MDYRFVDLVDVPTFQAMLQSFYEATGILHGLVDEEGNVLSASGWQEACTEFHRKNPCSNQRCLESNLAIAEHLGAGPYAGGKCRNGLMDYAAPIVIEDRQLATLYFGQFLCEPPDLDYFRRQAAECGFEEDAYLAAIRKLPVIAEERVEPIMAFYSQLAQMLAQSGLDRLRQREAEERLADLNHQLEVRIEERTAELAARNRELAVESAEHQQTASALRDSQSQLQAILDSSSIGIGWSRGGKVEYLNRKFTEMFGYTLEDIPTVDAWYQHAYPDDNFREEMVVPWLRATELARRAGNEPPTLEAPIVCKNGQIRYAIVSMAWVGERRLVNFSDITERWLSERRDQARNAILELIAKDASLEQTLTALVHSIEAEDRSMLCSVVLLDDEGRRVRASVAPSLPGFYNEAMIGLEIGNGVGSCGTAAYTRKRVIVEDIDRHPYWDGGRAFAQRAGLASCWSEPILSPKGQVFGTFAIYHHQKKSPTTADLLRITRAANLASIAIERHQTQKELERQANTDFLTGLANRRRFLEQAAFSLAHAKRYREPFSLLMVDLDHFKAVNDTYGHQTGDLVLKQVANILRAAVREVDLVGRFGGEEFGVMLPNTQEAQALQAAERLRAAVAAATMASETGQPFNVTLSVGIATLAGTPTDIGTLLQQADHGLYAAKEGGRNRVCAGKR
ncbi:MAG TPA: diguanylate cyclase [Rhodocyclaceae bacterium]|nr:diguanylate cyclase [Rhodocyclaceae bacterium]